MFRKKKGLAGLSDSGAVRVSVGSKLLELCNGDTQLYESLARILIVDPKRVTLSLESYLSDAQTDEAKGDKLRAELAYRIAGSIALFRGDTEGVRKYFEKALSLATTPRPEYKTLAMHPGNAVEVAKRFYENQPIRIE